MQSTVNGLLNIQSSHPIQIPIQLQQTSTDENVKSFKLNLSAKVSIISNELEYPPLVLIDSTESGNFVAIPDKDFIKTHNLESCSKTAYSFKSDGNLITKNNKLFCLLDSQQITISP